MCKNLGFEVFEIFIVYYWFFNWRKLIEDLVIKILIVYIVYFKFKFVFLIYLCCYIIIIISLMFEYLNFFWFY